MGCERVDFPGGFAIACSRGQRGGRCSGCGSSRVVALCDFPLRGAKAGGTCLRPLCRSCATRAAQGLEGHFGVEMPEGGFDLCRVHVADVALWLRDWGRLPLALPPEARALLVQLEAWVGVIQTAAILAEVRDQLHRDMRAAPKVMTATRARCRAALRALRRRPAEERPTVARSARAHLAVLGLLRSWGVRAG